MSEQGIVGRADLQKKDKGELQAIVAALGGKATSRSRKAELVDKILELSGVVTAADAKPTSKPEPKAPATTPGSLTPVVMAAGDVKLPLEEEPAVAEKAESKPEPAAAAPVSPQSAEAPVSDSVTPEASNGRADKAPSRNEPRGGAAKPVDSAPRKNDQPRRSRDKRGRNSEPPAEWETDLNGGDRARSDKSSNKQGGQKPKQNRPDDRGGRKNDGGQNNSSGQNNSGQNNNSGPNSGGQNSGGQNNSGPNSAGPNSSPAQDDDGENSNRRRRRRGRNRDRDDEAPSLDPVAVSGFMELRDDGYGFLRVGGWMQTKDDVYVPVRMVRQCGLRKGDHIVGTARPANRNEKNPAMDNIETINGLSPADARNRPLFEDLTPLFPDERLRLENTRAPLQVTPRIIDLIAPIGKGQRGLIVSPPKAGKTSIMKDIAKSIEKNNPEVHLVVLLIDERPEEVTDMARSLEHGEVVASTFDRPPEEHCALAELTIERAKRMVEAGEDVVILLDGITRLVRAYNMAGPSSGRLMSGGLDTAAIYPPKRFFGAARNLEEGGSLTILATALVETGSRMDEVIFEEFKGTGNMELRLDRSLAERGVFPAINIDGSSTRRPELLTERTERLQGEKLRKVLGALADSDSAASAGIDLLVDRLKVFKTNKDFLAEIAKM